MQEVTFQEIVDFIPRWIEARYVTTLPVVQGGWEQWIQIDFVATVNNVEDAIIDVQREIDIFTNAYQRVDWLFNANVNIDNAIAIELKAQSPKYTGAQFLDAVQEDLEKLEEENIKEKYEDATRYVMLFVINQVTFEALVEEDFEVIINDEDLQLAVLYKQVTD